TPRPLAARTSARLSVRPTALPPPVRPRQPDDLLRHRLGGLHVRRDLILSEFVERFPGRREGPGPLDGLAPREQRADLTLLAPAGGGGHRAFQVDHQAPALGGLELARLGGPAGA